ncbi:hypothetical protein BKA70DRAFT_852723 [Coprinopsis sp. MPI-PUGE-AT-0042]|nr:hypothetical protein BKA70DRAFT_852723 [Coprinopsis sp. MPI-PUGE-AT-0042]
MTSLETLHWSLDYVSPKSEDLARACFADVFEGLRKAGSVKHLTLTEQRRYGTKRCPEELKEDDHPLWNICGLKTLTLSIFSWISIREASSHFKLYTNNLSTLRAIELRVDIIPPDADVLACTFPKLQAITLTSYRLWDPQEAFQLNERIITFLARHPTIEYLCWSSWESDSLPAFPDNNFLPCLKCLSSTQPALVERICKVVPGEICIDKSGRSNWPTCWD